MVSAAATALLDQDGLYGRVEGWRFDLLDSSGNVIGELHPGLGVSVRNDTRGALKRSLEGFVIPPDEMNDVNVLTDRVRPMWLLDAVADEFPMGVFMFKTNVRQLFSYGSWGQTQLLDQGRVLGTVLAQTFSVAAGDSIRSKILDVFALYGFPNAQVDASSATAKAPTAFAAGSTTGAQVLTELCGIGGFFDWYFDNTGVPRVRTAENPATATPTFAFEYGGRVIDGTITIENDALDAPNQWICIDTANTNGAVIGTYELPAADPNSYASRKVRIAKVVEAPGIGTVADAIARAQAAATQDPRAFEVVKFQSIADPRHDTFDIVSFELPEGTANYLELSWSLTLAPGGPMEHEIKRAYV